MRIELAREFVPGPGRGVCQEAVSALVLVTAPVVARKVKVPELAPAVKTVEAPLPGLTLLPAPLTVQFTTWPGIVPPKILVTVAEKFAVRPKPTVALEGAMVSDAAA